MFKKYTQTKKTLCPTEPKNAVKFLINRVEKEQKEKKKKNVREAARARTNCWLSCKATPIVPPDRMLTISL